MPATTTNPNPNTKRTRSSPVPISLPDEPQEEIEPQVVAQRPRPRTPMTRRTISRSSIPSLPTTTNRPTLARSSTTLNTRQAPPSTSTSTPPHLTRSNSMFATPSPRRDAIHNVNSTPATPPRTNIGLGLPRRATGGGGVATLSRSGSTSSVSVSSDWGHGYSQGFVKNSGGGSGGGNGPKGENGPLFSAGEGDKPFGRGKENIPPRPDQDGEGSSRKRLRVTSSSSRASTGGRGRSGSVISVRSESSSTRHVSDAASTSSYPLPSRRASRLPSPSPSVTTATSFDTASSPDPLDMLNDDDGKDVDVDKTPTKARPVYSRRVTLPTPPPSSPLKDDDVEDATTSMRMIRVRSGTAVTMSSLSRSTTSTSPDNDEIMEGEFKQRQQNPYKRLKTFLRLSSSSITSKLDETIVGRDEEKRAIKSYLSFQSDQDVGMYVSGPPGTGKTASVTALGREVAALERWNVVEIGCMGLKVGDMWHRLGEELGCGKSESEVRSWIQREGQKTVIILDEIDSLLPPPPSLPPPSTSHLMSKLFTLPLLSTSSTTIKLIAISNTLDLTIRARLLLPEGNQPIVLPFKAYGSIEMTSIINARIERSLTSTTALSSLDGKNGVAKVDTKAVELLCRKVEAQNGDLRMCLGVLGSAINLAEAEWIKKSTSLSATTGGRPPIDGTSGPTTPLVKVSLPHILKALTSHTQQLKAAAGTGNTGPTTSTSRKIRSVPLQGKMVLVSILIYLSRVRIGLSGNPLAGSGLSTPNTTPTKANPGTISPDATLTTTSLFAAYTQILSHQTSPIKPALESDYRDLLSNLETLGLISLSQSSHSSSTTGRSSTAAKKVKIDLCVREDEVREGLGLGLGTGSGAGAVIGKGSKGVADDEVFTVFEREDIKIRRVKEKIEQGIASRQLACERMEDGF